MKIPIFITNFIGFNKNQLLQKFLEDALSQRSCTIPGQTLSVTVTHLWSIVHVISKSNKYYQSLITPHCPA